MSIFRIIFFLLAFYIIFRAVKYFIRFFKMSESNYNRMKQNKDKNPGYRDIEEAHYTEIKTEHPSGKSSQEQQK